MTAKDNNRDILDWEELSPEDQIRAEHLLKELNDLFDRNFQRKKNSFEKVQPEKD